MAGIEHVISVEELLTRKGNDHVRTEANETSRGNDQPIIDADQETQMSSIEVRVIEKDSPRQQRLDRLKKAGDEAEGTGPKIQKVPFLLRDHKNVATYFEPMVVSLGPIHHGKPNYQKAEEYKLRLAFKFVVDSGKGIYKIGESLYAQIEKKIKRLREYFDEEVTKEYEDEYLAWMLFVDGCAVLQFMYYAVKDKFKDVKIKNDQVPFWHRDLFLLENQLPYQLLEDLMELSDNKETLKNSIDSFIENRANCMNPKKTRSTKKQAHLLDRLRTRLLFPGEVCEEEKKRINKSNPDQNIGSRNVQELRAAGIQLKPSTTNSLIDVDFSDQFTFYTGYLSLPQITVDESTGPKFMNLMAYEMCPDFENDYGITSYICFLNSLIDHPEDVKELRKAGILHNLLGNDIKVAQLINDIGAGSYLVPNPETYAYVKKAIQKCYENNIYNYILNKLRTWIAEVVHDHFRSPWVILGLLAALLGLVLTAIQTWYTVYSTPGPCDDFCRRRP